jgi:hypothetical protein
MRDSPHLHGIRNRRNELAPQLAGHEFRRLRLREEDIEHRAPVEAARAAEEGLDALVVRRPAKQELTGFRINAPPGESARGLLDVLLAVMALAEREELHQLAREVLVGLLLAARRVVEIDQHRGVAGDRSEQLAEIAQRVPAQKLVLPVQKLRGAHLLQARYEVVVPEERHLFAELLACGQKLRQPPGLQLERALKDFALG